MHTVQTVWGSLAEPPSGGKTPWWEKPGQPSWPEDPCPLDSLQLKADTGVWPVKPIEPPRQLRTLRHCCSFKPLCLSEWVSEVAQSCPTLCDPMDCSLTRFLHPWDIPGKNTGNSLLPGIFPTQGLNPGLLHCRQMLYCLGHQGSHYVWG